MPCQCTSKALPAAGCRLYQRLSIFGLNHSTVAQAGAHLITAPSPQQNAISTGVCEPWLAMDLKHWIKQTTYCKFFQPDTITLWPYPLFIHRHPQAWFEDVHTAKIEYVKIFLFNKCTVARNTECRTNDSPVDYMCKISRQKTCTYRYVKTHTSSTCPCLKKQYTCDMWAWYKLAHSAVGLYSRER